MIEDLHPALHQALVAAPSDSMKSYLTHMAVSHPTTWRIVNLLRLCGDFQGRL